MSTICILLKCLRALSPAFLAPRSSVSCTEHLSARGEPAADAHPVSHAWCWLDRNLGFTHERDTRASFVDAGENYYAASREQTIGRALYNGSM